MWSYYGSKSKIVDLYPPPKHDKIIEPFAGSARYALKWFDRDVLLVDAYPVIVDMWKWLQNCSPNDILKLPRIKIGERVSDYKLTNEESCFLGFCVTAGAARPQDKTGTIEGIPMNRNCIERISKNLYKIKHWEIRLGSYEDIPNQKATWFIDPPYQYGGEHYVKSNKNIDFNSLADWCKTRKGQAIVCENTKADWMDFKPMVNIKGTVHKTTEAIWSNHPTNYDNVQLSLI